MSPGLVSVALRQAKCGFPSGESQLVVKPIEDHCFVRTRRTCCVLVCPTGSGGRHRSLPLAERTESTVRADHGNAIEENSREKKWGVVVNPNF